MGILIVGEGMVNKFTVKEWPFWQKKFSIWLIWLENRARKGLSDVRQYPKIYADMNIQVHYDLLDISYFYF